MDEDVLTEWQHMWDAIEADLLRETYSSRGRQALKSLAIAISGRQIPNSSALSSTCPSWHSAPPKIQAGSNPSLVYPNTSFLDKMSGEALKRACRLAIETTLMLSFGTSRPPGRLINILKDRVGTNGHTMRMVPLNVDPQVHLGTQW